MTWNQFLNPPDFIQYRSSLKVDFIAVPLPGTTLNIREKRFQGTGLGLSLTKSRVELHDGKIWSESDGEGLGAIFSFTLLV